MDIIYSRKRIKIPKIKEKYSKNKNAKKFFSIFIIVLIATITFYSFSKSMNPIFEGLCLEKVREIGTEIINNSSNAILNNMDYKNMVNIEKADSNNVLKVDVVIINRIASDIALEAQRQFKELEQAEINIPIGVLTGNKYLSGIGPNLDIKVINVGNVLTEIKSEFESKGINQTVYRIYLELRCKVSILTPYKTIDEEIVNQVLLVETVIVGNVPEVYYNLEGINKQGLIDVVQ